MEGIYLSTLSLFVLFGANWVLYGCLWLHDRFSLKANNALETDVGGASYSQVTRPNGALAPPPAKGGHGKVLSEPLSRSISSVRSFSRELSRLGGIVIFAYMCENHPLHPHKKKEHDMDMFWGLAAGLFLLSILNIRKSKGGDVLNREQTEEWKGWMQFMFLMYHYFSAHEVYNSIRVFITAYVWMTGFGNFSFFYLKGDFSTVRVLQMLWRLNFLVIFLCMVMGNHYILYYICPLHTFYFLVVYCVMCSVKSANYTKNGIRYKLLIAGLIIFAVWDLDVELFDKIFWFLGRKKVIGAGFGTMWEWYFRSSLDHWSTFLGMIYALNYPATALWMKKVEGMPPMRRWLIKGSSAAILVAITAVWAARILPLEKRDYNQKNAYFGVGIPVLAYIFLRNLTPVLRTRYLEPLHSLGKITLETYLMQHHVWLTSNAKTLLVIIPGSSKLNLIVVGCLYVLISKELYRLTMSLRGMCLPDDLGACLRNLAGIVGVMCGAMGVAAVLKALGAGVVFCVTVIACVGFCAAMAVHVILISKRSHDDPEVTANGGIVGDTAVSVSSAADGKSGKEYDGRLLSLLHTGPVMAAVVMAITALSLWSPFPAKIPSPPYVYPGSVGPHDACAEAANHGMWKVNSGGCLDPDQAGAYCNSHEWKWIDVPDQCQYHYLPPDEIKNVLAGRHIIVAGDSVERFLYYALIRSLGEATPMAHNTSVEKHTDIPWRSSDGKDTRISFLWATTVDELTKRVTTVYNEMEFDVLIMGGGLWDALVVHNQNAYGRGLAALVELLKTEPSLSKDGITMWVTMTAVVDSRLPDENKRIWMTTDKVDGYRAVVQSSELLSTVDSVIDGLELTRDQRGESYDGIHYSDLIYDAFAQVAVNMVSHFARNAPSWASSGNQDAEVFSDRVISGMGNMYLGVMVLFFAGVMVWTRDAYLGVPRLMLSIFGGSYFDPSSMSWEKTYGDLLRKLGKATDEIDEGVKSNHGKIVHEMSGSAETQLTMGRGAMDRAEDTLVEEAEALLKQDAVETGTGRIVELLGGRK